MTEVGGTGQDGGMPGGPEAPADAVTHDHGSATVTGGGRADPDGSRPDDRRRRHAGVRGSADAELRAFSAELLAERRDGAVLVPAKARASRFADELLRLLFPHYSEDVYYSADEIHGELELLGRDLRRVLAPFEQTMPRTAEETVSRFLRSVPGIYRKLRRDAEAIEQGDPAAESVDEVIATYPGFLAIAFYRVAHELHALGVPVFPRMLTECAHDRTGIDIHPGAQLGVPLVIDHGTGIVIGETAILGDNVKLYQGVTLGALSVDKRLSSSKRHPTIEGDVVIYSNATVLGGSTVVGHDSVIGGNVWLTESVPPYSVVQHRSEVRVRRTRTEQVFSDFVI